MALALGCGGRAPARPPVAPPVAPAAGPDGTAPACPMDASFVIGDGWFRCRELPFEIELPAGTTIERVDNEVITRFSAKLERGGLDIVVMPRMKMPRRPLVELVETIVRSSGIGATATRRDAAPVAGGSEAVAFALALPGGGLGEIRGYFVDHWMVAVMARGSAEDATRPDRPVGAKFLSSFRTRPVMDGWVRLDLVDGARIEIPGSAWPMARESPPDKGPHRDWAFHLPDRNSFLGVADLPRGAVCGRLAAARDDKLQAELRPILADRPVEVRRVERARLGDASAFLELVMGKLNEASYVICHGKSLIQVSVFGPQDHATLRVLLDQVAKTFVGAR